MVKKITTNRSQEKIQEMTQLFFMDESGHDHGEAPYEVRGGIAIHVSKLWNLVQDIRDLELQCFSCRREEIKGSKLLSKKSFKLASQGPNFPGERIWSGNS